MLGILIWDGKMGQNITNEAYIKDTAASGPLAGGANIYLRGVNITFGFSNIISTNPKVFRDIDVAYNTKKSEVTYTGFEQPIISVQGQIDLDITTGDIGDGGYEVMTIGRLLYLARTPKTYQLWDPIIVKQAIAESDPIAVTPYTITMPVIIKSISIKANSKSLNMVSYSIEFIEDKE